MHRLLTTFEALVLSAVPALACAESDKLHMFIEHETFYAFNGNHVLDVDLKTGVISINEGGKTVVQARLAGQGGRDVSRINSKRVFWVASVDVHDGMEVAPTTAGVKESVEDLEKLGGSWLLTYEYKKWASKQHGSIKHAGACNSSLAALVHAVLNVQQQCQAGGGPGCDSALDQLDSAFSSYLKCVEAQPVE